MTEGLLERREQRGEDAEGEPRQRTEEAEAHFLGAVSPIQAVSVSRHMKTTQAFHLHFVTDDIKETGRKNEANLFESYANEVYFVD